MIRITDTAAKHIRKMLAKRERGETALRLGVKAGGCSGLRVHLRVGGGARKPDDSVFDGADGAKVFVDPRSLRLLDGTVLDYDTSLLSKGFVVNNPHAKSTCGCGVSFSIEPARGTRRRTAST